MDGPRDYHTKWCKSDNYHIISLIHGILKNDVNEFVYKTVTDSQTLKTISWLPKGKRRGGGVN